MFIGVGTWLSPHILIFLSLLLQHSHYWFIGVPRRWDLIRSTSMDASTIIFSGRRIIWDRLSLHHMEAELRVIFDGILLPRWLGLFDIWVEADLLVAVHCIDGLPWVIQNIYREENYVFDSLASRVGSSAIWIAWPTTMTSCSYTVIQSNKYGLSSIRWH